MKSQATVQTSTAFEIFLSTSLSLVGFLLLLILI